MEDASPSLGLQLDSRPLRSLAGLAVGLCTWLANSNVSQASPAQAEDRDAVEVGERTPPDTESVEQPWMVGAFVDTAYLFNHNFPANHVYRGTNTTPRTNEFTVNLAAAYVRKHAVRESPWTFELALQAGPAADTLMSAEPIAGGEGGQAAGPEVWKHLGLANVGGEVRQTKTEIGAGLFASPIGIGGFWSKDNWNYSPSWESNAAPFYLAGARIEQALGDVVSAQVWIVNGWQTLSDVNESPSYLTGLFVHPFEGLQLAQQVYFGPDHQDTSLAAWRIHSDSQVSYDVERFGIGAVWDYGQEVRTDLPGDPLHLWTGGALFARLRLASSRQLDWDVAMRPEAWWDRDGVMFGVNQWLVSGTATTTLRLLDALLFRLEYRYDHSTASDGFFYRGMAVTPGDPRLANRQHTVFFSLLGYFERSFSFARG